MDFSNSKLSRLCYQRLAESALLCRIAGADSILDDASKSKNIGTDVNSANLQGGFEPQCAPSRSSDEVQAEYRHRNRWNRSKKNESLEPQLAPNQSDESHTECHRRNRTSKHESQVAQNGSSDEQQETSSSAKQRCRNRKLEARLKSLEKRMSLLALENQQLQKEASYSKSALTTSDKQPSMHSEGQSVYSDFSVISKAPSSPMLHRDMARSAAAKMRSPKRSPKQAQKSRHEVPALRLPELNIGDTSTSSGELHGQQSISHISSNRSTVSKDKYVFSLINTSGNSPQSNLRSRSADINHSRQVDHLIQHDQEDSVELQQREINNSAFRIGHLIRYDTTLSTWVSNKLIRYDPDSSMEIQQQDAHTSNVNGSRCVALDSLLEDAVAAKYDDCPLKLAADIVDRSVLSRGLSQESTPYLSW